MIVLDIETSGLDPAIHGIWQIGAYDLHDPSNTFLGECRIDKEDDVHPGALKVTGMTEKQLRDSSKMSQKEMLQQFFDWIKKITVKNLVCQNPHFDRSFLMAKSAKYGFHDAANAFSFPLHYRTFDLHSIAQAKHFQIRGKFLVNKEKGGSDMDLGAILAFCGMNDPRRKMHGGKVEKEGLPHDAMGDAKLTGEALSRLMHGKGLFLEFASQPVPQYLKAA